MCSVQISRKRISYHTLVDGARFLYSICLIVKYVVRMWRSRAENVVRIFY